MKRRSGRVPVALLGAGLLTLAGCAELPLENSAPEPPVLASDGVYHAATGVAVDVTCVDPDGDRITILFTAVSATVQQDFAWTSFIDSGQTATFYLDLGLGDWTLRAVGKDELAESGDMGTLDLNVHP